MESSFNRMKNIAENKSIDWEQIASSVKEYQKKLRQGSPPLSNAKRIIFTVPGNQC